MPDGSIHSHLSTLPQPTQQTPRTAQPDPILAIYAKWRALENTIAVQEAQHNELRQAMVNLYGDPLKGTANYAAWRADSRQPALVQATSEVKNRCDEASELLDVMIETPAASVQGVHCKLSATISVLKFIEKRDREAEYHETMALAVMRDAARVLGEGAAA